MDRIMALFKINGDPLWYGDEEWAAVTGWTELPAGGKLGPFSDCKPDPLWFMSVTFLVHFTSFSPTVVTILQSSCLSQ